MPARLARPFARGYGVESASWSCDEVVPGTKTITDVKDAIDDAARPKSSPEKIATHERAKVEVKYTDAWPHLKPGTLELAK